MDTLGPMENKPTMDELIPPGYGAREMTIDPQNAAECICPNCGADIVFDPETQKLKCPYCRSIFTQEEYSGVVSDIKEDEAKSAEANDEFKKKTSLYTCSSCGAQIIAENRTTATFCYYCHNPVILSGKLTGEYRPSKVIGFRLTREEALEKFQKWCNKRKFLPKDFNTQQQLETMTGLYVPFWVTDCDIRVEYQAVGKKVRHWTSGNYRYTETKEYSVTRNAHVFANGIPADGESKIDDLLMESIEPFNYADLKDFNMSYLSGFFADKYDVDKTAVFPRIKERATEASRNIIRSSVSGYSSVHVSHEFFNVDKTKWEYIMLPVWFMTYKYKDNIYEFALNGQTGKLAGTPPLDKKKLALFSAGIGLAAAALFYIGGVFFV